MAHWKQREIVFGEYELAMILAGRWQLRPSDSPYKWLYRSADKHREHLVLSREEMEGGAGQEESALRRVVARHRRAMELGFGRVPDLSMSEPQYGHRFGVPVAEYQGEAPSAEHRFQALFICPPRTVWILLYDAFRMSAEQCDAQTALLFGSIVLQSL
jgi:hypothetical protein